MLLILIWMLFVDPGCSVIQDSDSAEDISLGKTRETEALIASFASDERKSFITPAVAIFAGVSLADNGPFKFSISPVINDAVVMAVKG